MTENATLAISGLRIEVAASGQDIVDQVDLAIAPGEVLGLVGESGSGKTTVGLSVLGHARKGVRIAGGVVLIGETSMLELRQSELREARGKLVSYVPQDPSVALNPALRIDRQLLEVMEFHGFGGSDEGRRDRMVEVMKEVLLPGTPEFLHRYPHQLSGGQQQRVGLAMAFACRPSVIVLDEPTTGLDVSTQSHVLETIRELTREHGFQPVTAFTMCARVYRSGGFTKDVIYMRGLERLLAYFGDGGAVEPLLVGKIAFAHVPMVEELRWRAVLREPRLMPRYLLDDLSASKLARLRAGITILDLLEGEG